MRSRILAVILTLFICTGTSYSHPHVFADVSLEVVYDGKGLAGLHNVWTYDEMYSAAMLAAVDENADGKISGKEIDAIKNAILGPIRKNNYFNYVLAGTDFLKVMDIADFKVSMSGRKLVLDFKSVFSLSSHADWTMLVVVVADPTNYVQMTSDMENASVESPENIEVEYFSDGLQGLTLFRAFRSDVEGLFLRFKNK